MWFYYDIAEILHMKLDFPPKMTQTINFDAFTLLGKNSRKIHILVCKFFLPENPVV